MEGVVKNITEYGIFVDLGGVDGLLHITDISWGRVKHPAELYAIGDTINVKVLSFDKENERVSLGMKQLVPDPWTTAEETYPVGTRVNGRVVSLTDHGAFVEVEEGIEGLIHVSEMSWTRKVRHPSKVVSVGETVEAVVLDIRPENRRISLGMKQTSPNPWEMISEKYPIGSTIEGKIKNITDFGIFIGIDDDIDGLVHISDISWIKRIKHPSELYKKGDIIQARVLDIDKGNERFSLGIKQLEDDPWKSVAERYPTGTEINGTITNVTDFGIFVELEKGIEGLVHVSEISKEKIKTPVGQYEEGNMLTAKVMNINTEEKRIGLSIKRLEDDDDQSILEEYVNKAQPARSSFGEILKENLQEKFNGQGKMAGATDDADKNTVEEKTSEAVEEVPAETAEEAAPAVETIVDEKTESDELEASAVETIAEEDVESNELEAAAEEVTETAAEVDDLTVADIGETGEEVVEAEETEKPVEASVEPSEETADKADAPEIMDSDEAPVDSEPDQAPEEPDETV